MERAGGEEGAESLRRSQRPHRVVQSGAGGPRVRDGGRRTGGVRDYGGGGLRLRKFCVGKIGTKKCQL